MSQAALDAIMDEVERGGCAYDLALFTRFVVKLSALAVHNHPVEISVAVLAWVVMMSRTSDGRQLMKDLNL